MKKVLIIIGCILFMCSTAWSQSSPLKAYSSTTDSVIILDGAGMFAGIMIKTDGTNALTLNVYDQDTEIDQYNRVTGPMVLPKDSVVTTSAADREQMFYPPAYVAVTQGIVVDLDCAIGVDCWDVYSFTVYFNSY